MVKKIVIGVGACLVLWAILFESFMMVNRGLIKVLQGIPDKIHGLEDYQIHLRREYSKIKTCTWEEFRQEELEDLEYRIKQAEVVKVTLDKLRKLKELK